jgi:hypothetical protein
MAQRSAKSQKKNIDFIKFKISQGFDAAIQQIKKEIHKKSKSEAKILREFISTQDHYLNKAINSITLIKGLEKFYENETAKNNQLAVINYRATSKGLQSFQIWIQAKLLNVIGDAIHKTNHKDFKPDIDSLIIETYESFITNVKAQCSYITKRPERFFYLDSLKKNILKKSTDNLNSVIKSKRGNVITISHKLEKRILILFLDELIEAELFRLPLKDISAFKKSLLKLQEDEIIAFEPIDNFIQSSCIAKIEDTLNPKLIFKITVDHNRTDVLIINKLCRIAINQFNAIKIEELALWVYSVLKSTERFPHSKIRHIISNNEGKTFQKMK